MATSLTQNLTLFISGESSGTSSNFMGLFIKGGNPAAVDSMPLYLKCEEMPNNYLPLFIQVDGSYGYHSSTGSMNLHVERGPQAGFPLYMCNNGVEQYLPLVISGAAHLDTPSLTLYVCGDGGTPSNTMTLCITGSVPPQLTSEITLVIPNIVGSSLGVLPLYIHGANY